MVKIFTTLSSNLPACTLPNITRIKQQTSISDFQVSWFSLTVAGKFLTRLSLILDLSPKLTFHDFRWSGATWAFHYDVPLHQIMHHGTWKSDATWSYIRFSNLPTAPTLVVWLFGGFLTSHYKPVYLFHLSPFQLPS